MEEDLLGWMRTIHKDKKTGQGQVLQYSPLLMWSLADPTP